LAEGGNGQCESCEGSYERHRFIIDQVVFGEHDPEIISINMFD